MKIVKIQLEYFHGAIWCCDKDGIVYLEDFDIIKGDDICQKLNKETEEMFSSYYEFDSHDMACWFNYEQQFKDRFIMRNLLQQIVDRLNEINDGGFVVVPIALEFYNDLCTKETFIDLNKK